MKILAFDASGIAASAAFLCDGVPVAQAWQANGWTHSRTLLPLAQTMLHNAGLTLADADALAVSAGPGSFTGLRIAISLVKGLAFPDHKPCIGVSTPEAMAVIFPRGDYVLCAVMDARAGQVYNALFDMAGETPTRLTPDRAIRIDALRQELDALTRPVIVTGDGTGLVERGTPAPQALRLQSAVGVGILAQRMYDAGGDFAPEKLCPLYHRLPQAERERLERAAKVQREVAEL